MTHRFIGPFQLREGEMTVRQNDIVHQIRDVLRLRVGETIILSDGHGKEADAEITDLHRDELSVCVTHIRAHANEPAREAVLYCAILKKENFELVAQKATEVGVSALVPIITERTVKLGLRNDRLEKIMQEAAEQSGRSTIPSLSDAMLFDQALSHARENEKNVFFDPSGRPLHHASASNRIGIFIGPEGGWTESELTRAREAGLELASLGSLTLRAETAAIVASYLIIHGA